MDSFEQVQNSKLAAWAAENKKVDSSSVEIPIETPSEVTEVPEVQSKPVAEDVLKEEEPKTEVVVPEIKTSEEPTLSWDTDETPTLITKSEPTKFDFTKIGSALDLKELKGEDEVVVEISRLKSKLKELEDSPLNGIPDEFREVLEVAKKSGEDWRTYLTEQVIDYSKVDTQRLFRDEFYRDAVSNPKFFTDGKFDEDKAEDALESIPTTLQAMEGRRIQQGFINAQQARKQEIRAKAETKLANAEKSLSNATGNLQELLPVKEYGIQFESKHASQIYEGIVNSKLTKKHFGMNFEDLVKSGADMKAITRTATLAEYGERMLKFKSQSSKVEAKKELIDKMQNAQIRTPGSIVAPSDPEARVLTVEEKMKLYVSGLKKGL